MIMKEKVEIIESFIRNSNDGKGMGGENLAKGLMLFLIEKSNGFKEDVATSIVGYYEKNDAELFSAEELREIFESFQRMMDCYITRVNRLLQLADSKLFFSVRYGCFNPIQGLDRNTSCYTFWLAKDQFSQKAKFIVADREKLNSY